MQNLPGVEIFEIIKNIIEFMLKDSHSSRTFIWSQRNKPYMFLQLQSEEQSRENKMSPV